MRFAIRLLLLVGLSRGSLVAQTPATDSLQAAATVRAFHRALAQGDSTTVLGLLAQDVVILESGGLEGLADYRSHHLPADIGFARAVPSQEGSLQVTLAGNVAWVVSTSQTTGTFRERPINSAGAELIILSRVGPSWQIRAVHWSSRTRRVP